MLSRVKLLYHNSYQTIFACTWGSYTRKPAKNTLSTHRLSLKGGIPTPRSHGAKRMILGGI